MAQKIDHGRLVRDIWWIIRRYYRVPCVNLCRRNFYALQTAVDENKIFGIPNHM